MAQKRLNKRQQRLERQRRIKKKRRKRLAIILIEIIILTGLGVVDVYKRQRQDLRCSSYRIISLVLQKVFFADYIFRKSSHRENLYAL